MKKTSCIFLLALIATLPASAASRHNQFMREVRRGADIVGTTKNINTPDAAPGELGLDVYQSSGVAESPEIRMFIPTTMYVRAGGGLNLGFATDKANFDKDKRSAHDGYTTKIGLGWNLSSYVRTEIDFQSTTLKFSDLKNFNANYQTIGGMLYFDLARRYVQHGDITRMRHFVPFMGFGAGFGHYEFEGANGANGFVVAAPRAEFGFNVMITDLIGVDIAYQYQMMIGHWFGWNTDGKGANSMSNVIASFRVNF